MSFALQRRASRASRASFVSNSSSMFRFTSAVQPGTNVDAGPDYRLMVVEIVRCENLMPVEIGGSSDPFVKITVNGKVQVTKAMKGNLSPEFNVQFGVRVEDPEKDVLEVEVLNRALVGLPVSLGRQMVKLTRLERGRRIDRLMNLKQGFILIRMRALDFGVPPAVPEAELYHDNGLKQVVVSLNKAVDVVPIDQNTTADTYFTLSLGTMTLTSSTVHHTLNPTFKEAFILTVIEEKSEQLKLECFNCSMLGKDVLMGKCTVGLSNLAMGETKGAWVPLLVRNPKDDTWYPPKEGCQVHLGLCPVAFGRESDLQDTDAEHRAQIAESETRHSIDINPLDYGERLELETNYVMPPSTAETRVFAEVVHLQPGVRMSALPDPHPVVTLLCGCRQMATQKEFSKKDFEKVNSSKSDDSAGAFSPFNLRAGGGGGGAAPVSPLSANEGISGSGPKMPAHLPFGEAFVFPVHSLCDVMRVALWSGNQFFGGATIRLHNVYQKDEEFTVPLIPEEWKDYNGPAPPKLRIKLRAEGPNVPKERKQPTFKNSFIFPNGAPMVAPVPETPPPPPPPKSPPKRPVVEQPIPKPTPLPPPPPPKPKPHLVTQHTQTGPMAATVYTSTAEHFLTQNASTNTARNQRYRNGRQWGEGLWCGDGKSGRGYGFEKGDEDSGEDEDWRPVINGLPKTDADVVWLRVVVYMLHTRLPLTMLEYRMLRRVHRRLHRGMCSKGTLEEINNHLHEWATERERYYANTVGLGPASSLPTLFGTNPVGVAGPPSAFPIPMTNILALGQPVPPSLHLTSPEAVHNPSPRAPRHPPAADGNASSERAADASGVIHTRLFGDTSILQQQTSQSQFQQQPVLNTLFVPSPPIATPHNSAFPAIMYRTPARPFANGMAAAAAAPVLRPLPPGAATAAVLPHWPPAQPQLQQHPWMQNYNRFLPGLNPQNWAQVFSQPIYTDINGPLYGFLRNGAAGPVRPVPPNGPPPSNSNKRPNPNSSNRAPEINGSDNGVSRKLSVEDLLAKVAEASPI